MKPARIAAGAGVPSDPNRAREEAVSTIHFITTELSKFRTTVIYEQSAPSTAPTGQRIVAQGEAIPARRESATRGKLAS